MMNPVVVPVVHDLRDVLRLGAAHPRFGAFLDIGSFGRVSDVRCGCAGESELLGAAFEEAAHAANLHVLRARGDLGARAESEHAVLLHDVLTDPDAVRMAEDRWHALVAEGGVLALILLDSAGAQPPLWILAGSSLPVMGELEPCSPRDLWNTWFVLAGAARGSHRFLLEEPPFELDPRVDQALAGRLRELYGD